jgi:DNA-binding GntR family transcriptional regulator
MTLPQILESIEMRAVLEAHLLRKAEKRFGQSDIDKLRKICD